MNRMNILRKLNNIQMEIGRLMEDMSSYDEGIRRVSARRAGFKDSGAYAKYARELINKVLNSKTNSGMSEANEEELLGLVAEGYGDELKSEISEHLAGSKTKERSAELNKILTAFERVEARRRKIMEKHKDEFSALQNKKNDNTEKATITKNDPDEKTDKSLCLIGGIACIIIAMFAAYFLMPSILNNLGSAAKSLFGGNISIGDGLINLLKGVAGILAIAIPLAFGIFLLYKMFKQNEDDNRSKAYEEAQKQLESKFIEVAREIKKSLVDNPSK